MQKVRAVIADDERLMREQLRARLAEVWPELEIVAEAKNGREAVDAVAEHRPELVFLDIRMPGMTGVEAAREIGDACHVVFITAYSEYAVEAFEQGAVDYVLKPADSERLALTVARLKRRLGAKPTLARCWRSSRLGSMYPQVRRKRRGRKTAICNGYRPRWANRSG